MRSGRQKELRRRRAQLNPSDVTTATAAFGQFLREISMLAVWMLSFAVAIEKESPKV